MTENPNIGARNGIFPGPFLTNGVLNHHLNYSSGVYTAYCSVCHPMSEDIARGLQLNGRMSAVRRFFCLFVTFDLLLTSLIWLICLVLEGNFNFTSAFFKEIVHYNIKTSLSDVVMASLARFVILLFFYGLLHINHWIIVALTTVSTCCFSVGKVYMYDWSQSEQVLSVLLILSSFILSWAEGWLLDIKVIPQERSAHQYLTNTSHPNERTQLIAPFLRNTGNFDVTSYTGTFYSPNPSPPESDDEFERPNERREQDDDFKYFKEIKSSEMVDEAWSILNNDKWKIETTTGEGDVIHGQRLPGGEKVFRLTGTVEAPINLLIDVLYNKIDEFPLWNPTVKESKILQKLRENVDIAYQISAESGKGLVSSRDFVMLRKYIQKHDFHIIATASINHQSQPPKKNIIRAENGPGCWALKQIAAYETEVRWLLNINIRGWLPQVAVDSALLTVMADNMTNLRRRVSQLQIV